MRFCCHSWKWIRVGNIHLRVACADLPGVAKLSSSKSFLLIYRKSVTYASIAYSFITPSGKKPTARSWDPGVTHRVSNLERVCLKRVIILATAIKKKLLILDDLMRESSCDVILDLFTKGSHHKNISIIFITQNIFHKGKSQRDISLNTKYLVLYKNPRDRAQIQHLARQVYPEDPKFLQEAYLDATRTPHTYLFLDLSQDCLEEFRFRSCIFPDDKTHYAYVPKYSKFR